MSASKEIREYYGMSQQELAAYLNISQPLLAMVELGKRSLSTAVLLRLNHLEIHRANNVKAKKALTADLPAAHQKLFKKQLAEEIKKLQYKVQTLSMRLQVIKANHIKAVQKKSLVNMPATNLKGVKAAWLKKMQSNADAAIKKNHEGVQKILQSKIDGLLKQIDILLNIF